MFWLRFELAGVRLVVRSYLVAVALSGGFTVVWFLLYGVLVLEGSTSGTLICCYFFDFFPPFLLILFSLGFIIYIFANQKKKEKMT
jgi:hypothetical protein